MENLLFKDFGTFLNTSNMEQYEINKVVIFEDGKEKVITNYFLDNFSNNNYQFKINGNIKRKLSIDLKSETNFVVKSEKQDNWCDKTQYTLYINGKLNNFVFIELELIGERLDLKYGINGVNCSQCIGWNNKESNKIRYNEETTKIVDYLKYFDNTESYKEKVDFFNKEYKKYLKAKEKEKTYTTEDYKKMSLASGTTQEENVTMLKNNGFDIKGLEV